MYIRFFFLPSFLPSLSLFLFDTQKDISSFYIVDARRKIVKRSIGSILSIRDRIGHFFSFLLFVSTDHTAKSPEWGEKKKKKTEETLIFLLLLLKYITFLCF